MNVKSRSVVVGGIIIIFTTLFLSPWMGSYALTEKSSLSKTEPQRASTQGGENSPLEITGTPFTTKPVQLPFSGFIQNLGQLPDQNVKYYYSSSGMSIGFAQSKVIFVSVPTEDSESVKFSVTFPASQIVSPVAMNQKTHSVNYFYADLQITGVSTFNEIWYYDLYPGIDLRYYMSARGLKYEWHVHPGADPAQIAIDISDSMTLTVSDQTVSLQARTRPDITCFQDTGLQVFQVDQTPISARFILKDSGSQSYGVQVESYDQSQTLVIDPYWAAFSTFLGGEGNDYGEDVVVNGAGNSYIVGYTYSSSFPTLNAYNSTHSGSSDVFITKLNGQGNGILFSTYLGGSGMDIGKGITLDESGNIYLVGYTYSDNFPIVNAYQDTKKTHSDVFVTKLNPMGNGLIFSTFLGGNHIDYGFAITVDPYENVYVGGSAASTDFPTKNEYHGDQVSWDGFLTKLNATGNGLVFSTYLGGSSYEYIREIKVDADNNSYFVGETGSFNFPTKNAYQGTYAGGLDDVFVAKLNATGNGFVFSTFLGGTNAEYGFGLAIDANGYSYVTGYTKSSDFPKNGPYDDTLGGTTDAFVAKINPTGNGLVFSTYLGGDLSDVGYGIAVDGNGCSYITGYTSGGTFPTKYAYNDTHGGSTDAFMVKINAVGNDLDFSTYLGGSAADQGQAISLDADGGVYLAGYTQSSNFFTQTAYNSTHGGAADVFVTKFTIDDVPPVIGLINPANNAILPSGKPIELAITDEGSGVKQVLYNWDGLSNITLTPPFILTLPGGDGKHTLHVYVEDYAVHWQSEEYVVYTDDTPPIITLNGPVNGSVNPSGTVIDIVISDSRGLSNVSYNWDGTANNTLPTPYDPVLPEGDGQHILYVYAEDVAGNLAEVTYVFIAVTTTTAATTPGFPSLFILLSVGVIIIMRRKREK